MTAPPARATTFTNVVPKLFKFVLSLLVSRRAFTPLTYIVYDKEKHLVWTGLFKSQLFVRGLPREQLTFEKPGIKAI
jgi:hypothetical protein